MNSIKIVTLFLIGSLIATSCNKAPKNMDVVISQDEKTAIENTVSLSSVDAKSFLKTNCFACHNPQSTSHDDMLAPPLAGIKYKYKTMYPDRTTFISRMSDYIESPSKENTLMKGPIKRFGIMPKSPLAKSEITAITAYIYDNPLEIPDWFEEYFEDKHDKKLNQ